MRTYCIIIRFESKPFCRVQNYVFSLEWSANRPFRTSTFFGQIRFEADRFEAARFEIRTLSSCIRQYSAKPSVFCKRAARTFKFKN